MVKIGIIGLGKAWERLYAPSFERLTDKFQITAVCSRNLERANAVAHSLGLTENAAYCDYKYMLQNADIAVAATMVPITENYECARAVIKSGRHLIAEKPFASSVRAARELLRLRERHGVKVMVAENFRYDEENVLIKSLLTQNKVGRVVYFIDNYIKDFRAEMIDDTFTNTEWRKHPKFRGGVFLDTGVHHIARQRFLFGSIRRIYATGRPTGADFVPHSCINALISFNNGVAGHYTFRAEGRETQAPAVGLRIFGSDGEIYLEDRECGFVNISLKDGTHEAIAYTPGQGYYHELRNFYDALQNNAVIVSTPEKEIGDMKAIFNILNSIGVGKAV